MNPLLVGLGLGAAAAAITRVAGEPIGKAVRPLVRETIKGGIVIGREAQRLTKEARANLSELAAEARRELDAEERAKTGGQNGQNGAA